MTVTDQPRPGGPGDDVGDPGDDAGDPNDALDVDGARRHVLGAHADLLGTTLDCAAAVASGFDETVDGAPATGDSRLARDGLRTVLDRSGVVDGLAAALPGIVDAAGATMGASPVPAPPYVAVTSSGPVARATLGPRRLVVRIDAYEPVDGAFVWREPTAKRALGVRVRG